MGDILYAMVSISFLSWSVLVLLLLFVVVVVRLLLLLLPFSRYFEIAKL
jgi:hypothetical protein